MNRNTLWANSAALAAVGTTSCYVERTDNVEHLFFEGIHICLLVTVELGAVEYALTAAAGRTYVTACITTDTLRKFILEESKLFCRTHCLDLFNFCKTLCILGILGLAD